jgi:sugar transferase (PEP-CTERM/EpsH1 system associated)
MRILFLCHRLPYPPKRGGKIRPFNMIRHLSRRHEVTVATVARSAAEVAEGQDLRKYCHELHVGQIPTYAGWGRFGLYTATTYPATFGYFYSPALDRTVQTLLATRDFEAIFVHCSSMGPYVARHRGCRKILDYGDADSEKWLEYARASRFPLSLGFALEGRKVRRYERWLAEGFDACSVNAPREREVLGQYVDKPIYVFPNGVDLDYFRPQREGGPASPARVVFTGNMSYKPNVEAVGDFVSRILPRVWARRPETEFYIVGMDPSPAVRRLADGRRIVVTGRVDDVRPYFDAATVAVAPLRIARGLQNKVLEAMAMRVPVVASPAAFNGINAEAGRDVLVADDPESFSRGGVSLVDDPLLRDRHAAAARTCVERNHDWARILDGLERLVTEGPRPRAEGLPAGEDVAAGPGKV